MIPETCSREEVRGKRTERIDYYLSHRRRRRKHPGSYFPAFAISVAHLRDYVPSLDLLRGLTSSQTDKNGSSTGAAHANVSALLEVGIELEEFVKLGTSYA